MKNLYSVLKRPVITEKSVKKEEQNVYTFIIDNNSNKIEVKQALNVLYGVKVADVNIVPVRKKIRMIGKSKIYTKRKAQKKAFVTLKKGEKLDVLKFSSDKKK